LSLALTVYVYFGYPALLWIVSRVRPRPVDEGDVTPFASIVIPAFNEERNIAAKIENTLALDYPDERIEVLVVSNGSSDATNAIVRTCRDPRVRLLALDEPGKAQALNAGAAAANGEILVFTDADFLLDRHALRTIARKFHDPAVGGVCGARRADTRRDGDSTARGEGLYGRWDRWQKIHESRIGSVFAADGLLYAIRRTLYVPIADPAQADDIAISARVPLQGLRLLFEPEASAWENASVRAAQEFRRKVRVTNHSVRALLNLGSSLYTSGFYSVELLSHKLLRHFVPFFLIPLFAASALLASRHPFHAAAFAAQLALYGFAGIGWWLRETPIGRGRLFYIPYFFCFVNAAALVGVLSIMSGRKNAAWSAQRSVKISRL
ncbi:MAG TPA: glycosyltransferase, partial [Thermoanaerobaculia bacterium]|nr:glycosyltransferase [Thermoanaerobaculia bacterium]